MKASVRADPRKVRHQANKPTAAATTARIVAAQASASATADDCEFMCGYLQLRADVGSAAFVDPRPRFLLSSRVRVHQLEARSRLR